MWIETLAQILIPMTGIVAMTMIARSFPIKPALLSVDELRASAATFRKWDVILPLVYLVLVGLATYGCLLILELLARCRATWLPPAKFVLTPDRTLWLLPAMFIGLVISVEPTMWLARSLLRDRFESYIAHQNRFHGYDTVRASRFLGRIFIAISLLFVLLSLNWYTLVADDAVTINGFFQNEAARYAYGDVRSIRTASKLIAPNGNVIFRRQYVVTFANGDSLRTDWIPKTLKDLDKFEIADFISKKSGVPIEEIEVFKQGEW